MIKIDSPKASNSLKTRSLLGLKLWGSLKSARNQSPPLNNIKDTIFTKEGLVYGTSNLPKLINELTPKKYYCRASFSNNSMKGEAVKMKIITERFRDNNVENRRRIFVLNQLEIPPNEVKLQVGMAGY